MGALISEQREPSQIAQEAYAFLYPLVLMDVTRRVGTNVPLGVKPGFGPSNVFSHMTEFPPGDFKEVVRLPGAAKTSVHMSNIGNMQ